MRTPILVLASPIYRATVTGALKSFLDRFPTDGLRSTAVVLMATAASPLHYLSLDTSGRALVASLGGWTVPTVVYATGDDFEDGAPGPTVMASIEQAVAEATGGQPARLTSSGPRSVTPDAPTRAIVRRTSSSQEPEGVVDAPLAGRAEAVQVGPPDHAGRRARG